MISFRIFVISALGALLSVASLTYANDVKPSEPAVALQPPVIQELALQPQPFLALLLRTDALFAPLIDTPDLSRYREFRFGMDLLAVAKQAEMQPSDARVIHQRPAVIQELEWRPSALSPIRPRRTRFRGSSSAFTTASSFESWSIMIRLAPKG